MDGNQRGYSAFTVQQLSPVIGAELHGIDLTTDLSDDVIDEVRQALLQFKVIFFRDQDLTEDQHIAFARRFGELEVHPATPKSQANPEILRIAHGANSKGRENAWHSDVTWRSEPSLGSILRARVIPDVGGDTLFACMHSAYERLSPKMKAFVETLTARHDIARVFAQRLGKEADALREKFPIQEHPVIRTHPETGKRSIYVNTAFTESINDLSRDESDWLLRQLYAQAANPEIQCRFRWQANSIAFWDNRACQHFANSDYFPAERVMERVTIAGDRPFFTPGLH